jgi:hypothetical protein
VCVCVCMLQGRKAWVVTCSLNKTQQLPHVSRTFTTYMGKCVLTCVLHYLSPVRRVISLLIMFTK